MSVLYAFTECVFANMQCSFVKPFQCHVLVYVQYPKVMYSRGFVIVLPRYLNACIVLSFVN